MRILMLFPTANPFTVYGSLPTHCYAGIQAHHQQNVFVVNDAVWFILITLISIIYRGLMPDW